MLLLKLHIWRWGQNRWTLHLIKIQHSKAHNIAFLLAKNYIRSDFLEISLSLCFFPFDWTVTELLPTLQISNVWWHSWQCAVHALGPFSIHSNSNQPVIVKCTVQFSHIIFWKKEKTDNNILSGQNTQTYNSC